MTVTDPIADLFTRVRNALAVRHDSVLVPFSKTKLTIIKILKEEGFIKYYEVDGQDSAKSSIKIGLKYSSTGKSVISNIKRESTPGKRLYVQKNQIPKVLNGFGVSIVSTSKGILSGKAARLNNVGGELVGTIY